MKLARYIGNGKVEIVDEPMPDCPTGGLLIRTLACGLCSGELMAWYMDKKLPHVLGHEMVGEVLESDHPQFQKGERVFAHHHAPCMNCDACRAERYVQCPTWKRTKIFPGGMAEYFAVPSENLTDTFAIGDLKPQDAALIEPVACCVKSLRMGDYKPGTSVAVIGLGNMGLIHLKLVGSDGYGIDPNPQRRAWATSKGMKACAPGESEPVGLVIVCPGNQAALEAAIDLVKPGGKIVLFAPFAPDAVPRVPINRLYFADIGLEMSYSCGPNDTHAAFARLREGALHATDIVEEFIDLSQLPDAYIKMKAGSILKAMVLFP